MKNEERTMERKNGIRTAIMITLLFLSMIVLAFNLRPAQTTISHADPLTTIDVYPGYYQVNLGSPIYNSTPIQASVDYVPSGQGFNYIINVHAGTYNEYVFVVSTKSGLTLQGDGAILDGTGIGGFSPTGQGYYCGFTVWGADNVTIQNFTITNFLGDGVFLFGNYSSGVWVYAEYNTIRNNTIEYCATGSWPLAHGAIHLNVASFNLIEENIVEYSAPSTNIPGILVDVGSNNVIQENTFFSNGGTGITLVAGAGSTQVLDNNVTSNGWVSGFGIYSDSASSDLTIIGNIFDYNGYGSRSPIGGWGLAGGGMLLLAGGVMISNNEVDGNYGTGILLSEGSYSVIQNNEVDGNGQSGIEVALLTYPTSYNSISGNNVTNNEYGINIYSSSYNEIIGNNVTDNSYGLYLNDSSSYNSLIGNNVTNNNQGIGVKNSSSDSIYHNNFISNSVQVSSSPSTNTNTWDNGYPSGGNYWSDYNGTDLYSGPYQNITGSDGIGDTPYVIDTNNIDHYPLWYPYAPQYLTVVSAYDTAGGMGWYNRGATAYATLATGTVDIVPGWVKAVFIGWSGDATGTSLTSDPITMDGPKTAIADWKIQYYLQVATNPSTLPPILGSDWYDNWTYVSLTAPQYVPNATGVSGVRYNFTYWDVDGVSQGVGVNPISVHMDTYHVATAHFTLQYLVAYNQTGVGLDFTGTVVVIDGSNYNVSGLPASCWYDNGTTHSFAFQSPLPVSSGAKLYYWNSTSGLSTSQLDSITVTGLGSVTGNYVTQIHDVAVTNVAANRTWIYQGKSCGFGINVTVLNNGNFDENVTVTLYYNITAGETIGTQNITIPTGENRTLSFVWNTTGVTPCYTNYTLTAVATIPADYTPADNVLDNVHVQVRILGDIDGDGVVDGSDIALAAWSFASYGPNFLYPGSPSSARWNPDVDINQDNKIDGIDLVIIARNFGKSCTP
jgi:parallel beta-helix repeat protein